MKTFLRLYTFSFLILGLGGTGCSSRFSTEAPNELATDALTEVQNPVGRSYTSFSAPKTVQEIKDQVSFSDENKAFAKNIEMIQTDLSGKVIKIIIHWSSLSQPLIFIGDRKTSGQGFTSHLTEQSNQKPNFEISASCDEQKCESLKAFLSDAAQSKNQNKIGFVISQFERVLFLVDLSTKSTKERIANTSLSVESVQRLKQGLPILLSAFEIYPGKSFFEIKQDVNLISGELLSTSEGTAPTKATGLFAALGNIELIGNNQGNSDNNGGPELQFRITNQIENEKIFTYLKMENPKAQNVNHAPTLTTHSETNPLVEQILTDETHPIIQTFIKMHLTPNTKPSHAQSPEIRKFSQYLGCVNGDKKLCGTDHDGHDKTEIAKKIGEILEQNSLPSAWSLISFMESTFESKAMSPTRAYGYWQFTSDTASLFKLLKNGLDGRKDIKLSTTAAADYFKLLLRYWNGDVKMAVISYNVGPFAIKSACMKSSEDKTNCDVMKNEKLNERKLLSDLYDVNKKDFWHINSLHAFGRAGLPGGGVDYTIQFLSESIISYNPEKYGYSFRAVSLK